MLDFLCSADKALDEYHGEDSPQNLGQHRVPHMVGNDYQFCWCEKNAQDLKNKVQFMTSMLCILDLSTEPGVAGSQAALLCG